MYASDVLKGGPGPDDPLSAVAVRQRILSEAALRMTEPGRQPLVVVFPPSWTPPGGPDYSDFFTGLDVNWMRLTSLEEAAKVPARPLPADRFIYPQWQLNHEVAAGAFTALDTLTDEASRLQGVLTEGADLAARIRAEAFGTVSYVARDDDLRSLLATQDTIGWVQQRLRSISVSAPRRVILSSNSGSFSVTITNGLDEPVSVRLRTTSNPPMEITVPEQLDLEADASTTGAAAGVHRPARRARRGHLAHRPRGQHARLAGRRTGPGRPGLPGHLADHGRRRRPAAAGDRAAPGPAHPRQRPVRR